MAERILIVDDDEVLLASLRSELPPLGFEVRVAPNADAAMDALQAASPPELLLVALELRGESGVELAERVRGVRPDLPVVLMAESASLKVAVAAMRAGIEDFITKPLDLDHLEQRLRRALRLHQLVDEVTRLREARLPQAKQRIIGESPAVEKVRDLAGRVADSEISVLITGESGTGKELLAREIHDRSPRREGPFIAVNCATFVESLAESELFGHKKGSFTGARADKDGLFLAARGGTLFLDEVGELNQDIQAKLLRALEVGKVRPVGGAEELPYDARILAATNRDLEEDVEAGVFREDLYYRLNVVGIHCPPLRVRGHDIVLLAQHFLDAEAKRSRRPVTGMVPEVAQRLLDYDWPGNVRELQNCMRRGVTLARHDQITVEDLPPKVREHARARTSDTSEPDPAQMLPLAEVEKRYIRRVLDVVDGNKSQAARVLGMNRRTLYRRLEEIEANG